MDINFKINVPKSQDKWTSASNEYYTFVGNAQSNSLNYSIVKDLVAVNDTLDSFMKLETHIMSAMKAKLIKKISKSRTQMVRNSFIDFAYEIDELVLNYNNHRFANAIDINKYIRIEDEVYRIFDEQFGEISSSDKEFIEYSQFEKVIFEVAKGIYMNLKSITTSPKLFSFEDRGEICYVLKDISDILLGLNYTSTCSIKYKDEMEELDNE